MGSTTQMDWAGQDLIVNTIRTGATTPGTTGSAVSTTSLIGITAGTATASKALVLGASKNVDTIQFDGLVTNGTAATTKSNASAVTCSSNAATTATQFTKITSESLTTAHTSSQALVITYTGTATTDFAVAHIIGGTNTQGVPVLKTACTTNTVTITIQNNAIATNAFNGTFIIWLQVFKG